MAIIANLGVKVFADIEPMVSSIRKISDVMTSGVTDLQRFTDGFTKLHDVGARFRDPKAFGGTGQFIGPTEASGIFSDALERLQQRLSSLSSDVFASSPSFIQQSVAIVASSRSMEMMNRSASALMGSLSATVNGPVQLLPSRVIQVATAVRSAIGPFDRLGTSLQRLRLANYNFLASVEKWDINGVIAGAGAAAKALDTLNSTFLGITAPGREVQKLMSFLTPAVAGFAAQMMSLSNNPALQVFGDRLKELSEQTAAWGNSVQLTMGEQIFGRFSMLSGASDQVVAAFTRKLFPVLGAGLSATVRGSLGVFDQLIAKLTGVAGRGTQIFDFFGAEIKSFANDVSGAFGPMTEKILRASYALIRLGTIGTAKGLYYTTLGAAKLTIVLSTLAGRGLAMATRGLSSLAGRLLGARRAADGSEFSRLSKDLDRMSASAGRAKGGMGGIWTGLTQLFPALSMLGPGGVVAAGVVGFGALAKSALTSADGLEQGQLKYQTILGSASAATDRFAELTKFADTTPFNLAEVMSADQQLQAFGIRSLDTLTAIGNAAAVSGQDFSGLSYIIGQVAKSNSKDNLDQLVSRGIISFDELRAKGIEFAKDGSVASSIEATYDAVINTIAKKTAGGMDALAGTVSGKMSTLSDKIGGSLGKLAVGSGLVDGVKRILDVGIQLGDYFQSTLIPILSTGLAKITTAVSPFANKLITLTTSTFPYFASAWGAVAGMVVDWASWLGSTVSGLVTTAFGGLGMTFGDLVSTAQMAFLMIEYGAMNWRKALDIALLAVSLEMVKFSENAKYLFGTVVPKVLGVLGENFMTAGAWMANVVALSFVKIADIVRYTFTDVIPAYVKWFGENWQDIFFTLFEYTSTVFVNLGNNIRKAWTEIWDFIKSGGQDAINIDWTPLTKGAFNAIKELPQIADRIAGPIEQRLSEITAGGPKFKAFGIDPRMVSPLEMEMGAELGKLTTAFSDGFADFAANRLDSIATPAAAIAASAAATLPDIKHPGGGAGESKGKKSKDAEILSTDDVYRKLAQAALKKDDTKDTAKNTKDTAKAVRELVEQGKRDKGVVLRFKG